MEGMLAHHMLDVRRFISENLESNADRVVSDLRLLMQDQVQPSAGFEPSSRPMDWKLWLAAAALVAAGRVDHIADGIPVAATSIDSGAAAAKLAALASFTNQALSGQ